LHHTNAPEMGADPQNTANANSNISHQYQTHSMSGVGIISGQSAKHEGLDYSLQRSATDVYSSMMPTRTHIQNQTLNDRRTGGENQVYNTYDPSHPSAQTHSALNYPNSGSSAPNPHSQQMNKTGTSGTSTSPPQSTWTPRHLNRVSLPINETTFHSINIMCTTRKLTLNFNLKA